MIIYCTQDLIFATKIASTAETLNVPARPARDLNKLRDRLNRVDDGSNKPNDPVTRVFIDMEMADTALAMIETIITWRPPTNCPPNNCPPNNHPTTNRPTMNNADTTDSNTGDTRPTVVAFGSHVAAELLRRARAAGADHVMPRSQFTQELPMLIEQHDPKN